MPTVNVDLVPMTSGVDVFGFVPRRDKSSLRHLQAFTALVLKPRTSRRDIPDTRLMQTVFFPVSMKGPLELWSDGEVPFQPQLCDRYGAQSNTSPSLPSPHKW